MVLLNFTYDFYTVYTVGYSLKTLYRVVNLNERG